jgi:uncharacterized protein (TIGR03435 family)
MRLAAGFWFAVCALAQQPTFDVASFRRMDRDPWQGTFRDVKPASLTFRQASLGNLIYWAYGYEHFQVVGPAWRDRPTDVLYMIEAKTAGPVEPAQMKLMLQQLLQERLGLTFHRELRDAAVYALMVDRGGPKFHASATAGDPKMRTTKAYVTSFERVSMADFVKTLDPPFTSRHVVDETGLTGVYDFTVDLSMYVLDREGKPILDARGAIDNEGANLLALPKQLGLKLERKTKPLEVMVIDRVAKDPGAN